MIDILINCDQHLGYPPAGFVSGICAKAAFFKYKDIISFAVIPACG
jgi:hypothetical protein